MMRACVLDSSVVVKWFSKFGEDDLEKAYRLRLEIEEGRCLVTVPDLLFYELANALRYSPRFTAPDVKEAVNSLLDMGLEVRPAERSLMEQAVELAYNLKVTVYDACYLALAQRENSPLVTADYKFAEKLRGFKNLIKLSEV